MIRGVTTQQREDETKNSIVCARNQFWNVHSHRASGIRNDPFSVNSFHRLVVLQTTIVKTGGASAAKSHEARSLPS